MLTNVEKMCLDVLSKSKEWRWRECLHCRYLGLLQFISRVYAYTII